MDPKDSVTSAIASAQASLEQAMMELAAMPSVNANSVAFAAHALNNYLAVTGGLSDLLASSLGDYPDRRVVTWVASIQRATRMMGQIVGALMKDALVSGNARITLERVDLATGLATICEYYRNTAERKQMYIVWEPPPGPCYVWTDNTVAAAVMDNLLSNAIKFSQPGTTIVVSVRLEPDAYVVLVRDEGPGLSAEDMAQLFQRGVRLSAQPTGGEASHGYGLAVAKELLDLVGGEIWCESRLGAGATFLFRLPAYRE
jgi:signal transduction histidine kinase